MPEPTTKTVGWLIAELQKQDPNNLVMTEGCDCWGDVVAVQLIPKVLGDSTPIVLICRDIPKA